MKDSILKLVVFILLIDIGIKIYKSRNEENYCCGNGTML